MKITPGKPALLKLRVTATAETLLRRGHPWLFAESIREQNRAAEPGELAVIYDRKDEFLAVGLFDPESPIRVRILHAGKPQKIESDWWRKNVSRALEKRSGLFDQNTTGYRCINGESDHWPALVLDRYDQTLVLKIYSGIWFSRLPEIISLIAEALPNERIVLRLSRNIQAAAKKYKLSDGQILFGAPLSPREERVGREPERGESHKSASSPQPSPPFSMEEREKKLASAPVIFQESGLRFEADVLRGQKTGFFLDQRENRRIVGSLAKNKSVLNAFSFSGGFSVYAARGGATSVTDLDISNHALESAKRNFALNQNLETVASCRHETIQTDVFEWLQKNVSRSFDLVILDPPSLAKRESERADAVRAYEKLNSGGISHLSRGGILVAASCSAHVSKEEFFESVRRAARASGRKFSELQTTLHASDHAANFKEAEYLKCIYLKLD